MERDGRTQRFVWNKLITGEFRVGVSQQLVMRALAEVGGLTPAAIAHRLMGDWQPTPEFYRALVSPDAGDERGEPALSVFPRPRRSKDPSTLGDVADWQAEWKWDGIRAQLVRRRGETFLWSRGEELVTDRFPEIADAGARCPTARSSTARSSPWKDGQVLPFAQLQRRIGRKTLGKKILAEVPVVLAGLRPAGVGRRGHPRAAPCRTPRAAGSMLAVAPAPRALLALARRGRRRPGRSSRPARGEPRAQRRRADAQAARLAVPRRAGCAATGGSGRSIRYTVDAVLIYAQRGSGKRASLFTDYTFAVWDERRARAVREGVLRPDRRGDPRGRRVRPQAHAREVRPRAPVKPELVFELGFEGIQRSTRHKSGIAVRFPRILRQRPDKKPEEADHLDTLLLLVKTEPAGERYTEGSLFDE